MALRAAILAGMTFCALRPAAALAQNRTVPGAVTLPYPTTGAVSIEWSITGDANNNGIVSVRYRADGAAAGGATATPAASSTWIRTPYTKSSYA